MKICGIYGIHNIVNGKWYVGQSTHIERRKKYHFWILKHGKHNNQHLQSAFLKYGIDNFEFHVLEEMPKNMLDVRESAWIIYYKSNQELFGYNLDSGGNFNKIISSETRKKMSKKLMGNKYALGHRHSFKTRERISNALVGKHFSEEHNKKISDAMQGHKRNLGRHHSEETKRKMSEAQKGRVPSPQTIMAAIKAHTGKHPSSETLYKMSEAHKGIKNHNFGKHRSEETKRKISESKRNRKH